MAEKKKVKKNKKEKSKKKPLEILLLIFVILLLLFIASETFGVVTVSSVADSIITFFGCLRPVDRLLSRVLRRLEKPSLII